MLILTLSKTYKKNLRTHNIVSVWSAAFFKIWSSLQSGFLQKQWNAKLAAL